MAGIQKGSSDNLTSPIPHLLNADFLTATARLAAGQVHYAGRDYYQRDTDSHYRLKALGKCFAADGTTPATMPGTWGTLEAHWVTSATAGLPGTNGVNGNRVLALTGAPVLSDGNLADLAIVTTVGDLYEKTASGWALRGNLKGPAGTGGTGTSTAGVTAFNTRAGAVMLTASDVLGVVNNSNQLAGGLHNAATKAAMLAIPASLRDFGMTVIVYLDPTAANNGRYDLATDLQTWIKQGVDLVGQFAPYNAALLYNTASAYITYPDPVSLALRIFHSLALTAPAVQPAPVSSTNVLNPAWEEISPSAAVVTRAQQATNLNLGLVRGNGFAGATGNVSVNADGSQSAPVTPFYLTTGLANDGYMTQAATTTALALLAPLASPTFTGIAAADTAPLGTSTTQLASTAFVQTAIATNTIEVTSWISGKKRYYGDFYAYFTGPYTDEQDVVRFGAGIFDNRSVSRFVFTKSLSIILGPQTSWLVNEIAPYPGIGADPTKNVFSLDGSGRGKLTGNIIWYTDSYSAAEKREVHLFDLIHAGRIQHMALPNAVDLPIKLRLTNVTATMTGTISLPNVGSSGCYVLATGYFRNSWRSLEIEANNCRFYIDSGTLIDSGGLNDTAPYTFPAFPIHRAIIRNSVLYLSEAYAGTLSLGSLPAMVSVDSQNVRVKTPATTVIINTGATSTSPLATTLAAGIVKIGTGISVTADGTISAASGGSFTAITANQYGTHPAFSTQDSLNGYLLNKTTGTAPTQTVTATSATPS